MPLEVDTHWYFTYTSANVIYSVYCITYIRCKKLFIGETERRLGDRFREHLCDVEKDRTKTHLNQSRDFNVPIHSMQHMAVCSRSLCQGRTESRKTVEQKFNFQIDNLNPQGINKRFSFHVFCRFSRQHAPTNNVAPSYGMNHTQPTIPRLVPMKG